MREVLNEIARSRSGPEDLDFETGLEFYKLISQISGYTEHDAYSTILGYPPDEGILAL